MTDRAILVLHGLFQLTDSERNEVIQEVNKYEREPNPTIKKSIERKNDVDFNRVVSGPVGVSCSCCGR